MQTVFAADDRVLRIAKSGDTIEVAFGWPVAQILPLGSVCIVRTEPAPGARDNRNVFAVDADGAVVWRVAAHRHVYEDSPYTHVSMRDGLLILSNWDGLTLSIEPFTWAERGAARGR